MKKIYAAPLEKQVPNQESLSLDAIDSSKDGYLLPITTSATLNIETLDNYVKLGQEFSTDVVLNNVKDIYAEDFTVNYNEDILQYIGYQQVKGIKVVKDITTGGVLRFIIVSEGRANAVNDSKIILKLKFKAIKVGSGKVDATKARIADIAVERDLEEINCGEQTIMVREKLDVNRTGEFTLVDLAIDAYYYNEPVEMPDTVKYNADVVQQVVTPEDEIINRFGVDVIDLGRAFNDKDDDWYDYTLADGSTAQYPKWFRPEKSADGSYDAYHIDGTHIAKMPEGATFFDQTIFPYVDGYPDNLNQIDKAMDKVLWSHLVHSPWDNANDPKFWQKLREKAIELRNSSDNS